MHVSQFFYTYLYIKDVFNLFIKMSSPSRRKKICCLRLSCLKVSKSRVIIVLVDPFVLVNLLRLREKCDLSNRLLWNSFLKEGFSNLRSRYFFSINWYKYKGYYNIT